MSAITGGPCGGRRRASLGEDLNSPLATITSDEQAALSCPQPSSHPVKTLGRARESESPLSGRPHTRRRHNHPRRPKHHTANQTELRFDELRQHALVNRPTYTQVNRPALAATTNTRNSRLLNGHTGISRVRLAICPLLREIREVPPLRHNAHLCALQETVCLLPAFAHLTSERGAFRSPGAADLRGRTPPMLPNGFPPRGSDRKFWKITRIPKGSHPEPQRDCEPRLPSCRLTVPTAVWILSWHG